MTVGVSLSSSQVETWFGERERDETKWARMAHGHVAQLGEGSLSIPEVCGSHPVIGKIIWHNYWKEKTKIKRGRERPNFITNKQRILIYFICWVTSSFSGSDWATLLIKNYQQIPKCKTVLSGRYSSLDPSAPSIIRPKVRIPCTPSTLLSI